VTADASYATADGLAVPRRSLAAGVMTGEARLRALASRLPRAGRRKLRRADVGEVWR